MVCSLNSQHLSVNGTMKKIAFIFLLILALWQFFYQEPPQSTKNQKQRIAAFFDMSSSTSSPQSSIQEGFHCDRRQTCNEMNTQAEAAYFYQHCPNQKLKIAPDGTPCGTFFK
ncbi:MAG TPA: hypothetical protein DEB62_02235 [Vibrio sp.]|nr:hypothetical protein [Vibrio sp.]